MEYLIETVIDDVHGNEANALAKALQIVVCGRYAQKLWAIRTWPLECGKWKLAFYHIPSTSPAAHLATFKALHDSGELDHEIASEQSWCVGVGDTVTRYKDMAKMKVLRMCEDFTTPVSIPHYLPPVTTS